MAVCRYTWVTGREPLTYYDMNLSAQDHQTFFTCDSDHLRPADASKQMHVRYMFVRVPDDISGFTDVFVPV